MTLKQQRRDNRMNLQERRRNARINKGLLAEIGAVRGETQLRNTGSQKEDGDYLEFMILTAKAGEPVANLPSDEPEHWYDGEMEQLLEALLDSETAIPAGV